MKTCMTVFALKSGALIGLALVMVLCVLSGQASGQTPSAEFTVLPPGAIIAGVSADGDVAAITPSSPTGNVGWWRRGQGIQEIPASTFQHNGVNIRATLTDITADAQNLVGYVSDRYVFFYNQTAGLRTFDIPFTPRSGYGRPLAVPLSRTADRIVALRIWFPLSGGAAFWQADVVVWTAASNTWQQLFTPPVAGSFVWVNDVSDNGVSIGELFTGGFRDVGTRYTWIHHPVNGVTLYNQNNAVGPRISDDGGSWTLSSRSAVSANDVVVPISPPNCSSLGMKDVANHGSTVAVNCILSSPPVPGSVQRGQPFVTDLALVQSLGIAATQENAPDFWRVSGEGMIRYGQAGPTGPGQERHPWCILKIFSGQCDRIDFNNDGLFPSDEDIIDFLHVLAGGQCSNAPNCLDIDFNNDGLFPSDDDLIAFFRVFAGGSC
jgi:hypothetical protein